MRINDNLFCIGDCIHILPELLSEYGEPFVDLAYLDPPFNSGIARNLVRKNDEVDLPAERAYYDAWHYTKRTEADFESFVNKEAPGTEAARTLTGLKYILTGCDKPDEKRESFSFRSPADREMLSYLIQMTRRLFSICRVMKPNASIYLHCDPVASHYLKAVMDAVFGMEGYRRELIWPKQNSGGFKSAARNWIRGHDVLLFYTKSAGRDFTFNKQFVGLTQTTIDTYNKRDAKGLYFQYPDGRRKYLHESPGAARTDVLSDIRDIIYTNKEKVGYPTEKPDELLRLLIETSSDARAVVLDPYCGSGPTMSAAYGLDRKFIGIDVSRAAAEKTHLRMKRDWRSARVRLHNSPEGRLDKLPENDSTPRGMALWQAFQFCAVASIPKATQRLDKQGRPLKGADGAIDGMIHIRKPSGMMDGIVIQVKRHRTPTVADVADTAQAVRNEGAFMGLLVTLHPPTKGMIERGAKHKKELDGEDYPEVAILTLDEVRAGKYHDVLPYHLAVDVEADIAPKEMPDLDEVADNEDEIKQAITRTGPRALNLK